MDCANGEATRLEDREQWQACLQFETVTVLANRAPSNTATTP
jgi:hypothetical protein